MKYALLAPVILTLASNVAFASTGLEFLSLDKCILEVGSRKDEDLSQKYRFRSYTNLRSIEKITIHERNKNQREGGDKQYEISIGNVKLEFDDASEMNKLKSATIQCINK